MRSQVRYCVSIAKILPIQLLILIFSRHLAETSPYYEAIKAKNHEVLFCYEPYDELVLLQLQQFDRMNLISVEKAIRKDKSSDSTDEASPEGKLSKEDVKGLSDWIKSTLGGKCSAIKVP